MAQRIANKFPVDQQPNQAVGVSINFNGGGDAVFTQNYSTKDQIKSNLINYFLTNKGERPFQPNFGANLREFVFEQINNPSKEAIIDRIKTQLAQNFPNVNLVDIELYTQEDRNIIQVIIKYNVIPFGISDQLNLSFS